MNDIPLGSWVASASTSEDSLPSSIVGRTSMASFLLLGTLKVSVSFSFCSTTSSFLVLFRRWASAISDISPGSMDGYGLDGSTSTYGHQHQPRDDAGIFSSSDDKAHTP